MVGKSHQQSNHIGLFDVDYIKYISVHIKETVNWISKEILLSKSLTQSALRISRICVNTLFCLIIWKEEEEEKSF